MAPINFPRRSVVAKLSAAIGMGWGLSSLISNAASATESPPSVGEQPKSTRLQAGTHWLEMPELSGGNTSPMGIFVYQPEAWTTRDGIMIVMHGIQRDADFYLTHWSQHARASGMLLITPEFNTQKFPGRHFYNFGNVVNSKMQANDRSQWTFDILDHVFAHVKLVTGAQRENYALYGHSAGAQFVHRFMLLASSSKAQVIVSANAGSYTMPLFDVEFPWGLKNTAVTPDDLRRAFARNVVVLLGDQDIDPQHRSLPRDPQAMAQGPFRLARGQLFFETAKKVAASMGTPFAWRLNIVPGVEHSDPEMAPAAMAIIRKGMS